MVNIMYMTVTSVCISVNNCKCKTVNVGKKDKIVCMSVNDCNHKTVYYKNYLSSAIQQ